MHQHLGKIGAVRLVLGLLERELDGADDAARIFRHQQSAAPAFGVAGDAAPERHGLGQREWMHKAHRRPALDAVDQHQGERLDLAIADAAGQPAHGVARASPVVALLAHP